MAPRSRSVAQGSTFRLVEPDCLPAKRVVVVAVATFVVCSNCGK